MRLIALTGGIGSGKSVVARILGILGYEVYDCDSRAKSLISDSQYLKNEIIKIFGHGIIKEGNIDRKKLADAIFSDDRLRISLNEIVHKAVTEDLIKWKCQRAASSQPAFVECAILETSGLLDEVDSVWWIEAPLEIRMQRAVNFRNIEKDDFLRRVKSQEKEIFRTGYHLIENNDTPLLPRILHLLEIEKNVGIS